MRTPARIIELQCHLLTYYQLVLSSLSTGTHKELEQVLMF